MAACKKPIMTTIKSRVIPPDYRCSPGPVYKSELEQPTPGPGAYSPVMPAKRSAPAFSIRLPVKPTYPSQDRRPLGRGPASYNTRSAVVERPAFKLTCRRADKHEDFPAPNVYSPHEAPGTNKGYSLRPQAPVSRSRTSRGSVFTGLDRVRVPEPMSKEMDSKRVPLA
ncbi:hypothetical protein FJT64_012816 [Amphibalanus amphitrite]|uniref:Outer dense fiber protein 3-like protein 2 n=1 Tax=Amphibalanus amphitrite TaxID=1232801 RepID=A0A6A4VEF7_AMPAM|nr:hypothetical protein FJT64_012816 [Amphibalanus amphitrite]